MYLQKAINKIFIIFFIILPLAKFSFSQCIPYLGQTPPDSIPKRLVPDSLAANNDWQYHGTPSFSPDGKEMYYAIYRYSANRVEIWYSECVNGIWISPKKAPFSNDSYSNNNPIFSHHKDTLYYLSPRPNGIIFKVVRINGVWSSPSVLNLPFPSGYNSGLQFSIADNGNLYSELSLPGGEADIYLWPFVNGQYQSPEKLTSICSSQLDFTPYIDPAERFIMFSSRRSGGFGNSDIYISKRNPDKTWASPINLGGLINSGEVIQPTISRDGKYFFFESWVPGALGGNPYWVDADFIYKMIIDTSVVTDYDGNTYKIVKIGNQIWMAENLRSIHYSDGTLIPFYNYNNDTSNVGTYGRLYSSQAVMKGEASSNTNPSNVKGISPVGWHLPSKSEWEELAGYLGGINVAGGKLKETGNVHWAAPNTGATNESGFTALPGGMHDFTGIFQWGGNYAAFSTSTLNLSHIEVSAIRLQTSDAKITIGTFHPDDALSVRCVKNKPSSGVKDNQINPTGFILYQNYPNPFNPSTTIKYELKTQSYVKLNITNILGETVFKEIDEMQTAGQYEYKFSSLNLPSGIYFYRLTAGKFAETKKMLLIK